MFELANFLDDLNVKSIEDLYVGNRLRRYWRGPGSEQDR